MILSILAAIFAVFIVILIHEGGHFLVARAVGIHVEKFSIGFGRALYKWHDKHGTEFVLALIPLGGYVKMQGDNSDTDSANKTAPKSYASKSVFARMAVVLAGPAANFILAFLIYIAIYTAGVTHLRPVIGSVQTGSIAASSGFVSGQEVKSVDGYKTNSWQKVLMAMILNYGGSGSMAVTVRHNGLTKDLSVPVADWRFDMLKPDPFKTLGFEPYAPPVPPIIDVVSAGSPAAIAGLQPGDRVVQVNTQPVSDWEQMSKIVNASPAKRITLEVLRDNKRLRKQIMLASVMEDGKAVGQLGVIASIPPLADSMKSITKEPIWLAWRPALQQSALLLHFNAMTLLKMLKGEISVKALGGPITIFRSAGLAATSGWIVFSSFVAFISLMIGFINILPIPALDGGHFFFQLIELIFRKPMPLAVQNYASITGLFLLLLLMLQATYNDIVRLF
jgi:regulator of sigma E protease